MGNTPTPTLAEQSTGTRKASTTRPERIAKRREKYPLVPGFKSVEVEAIGGDAAVSQSSSQGGFYVEYIDLQGYAHAVPVEALAALGFAEPTPNA